MSADSPATKRVRKARIEKLPIQQAASPESEYRFGPGRRPKETQFKPGQSGNPSGAKKKPPPLGLDIKAMLEAAFNTKIRVKEGERERIATRLEIGLEQLMNQFAKGDRYARRDVFELAERFGVDLAESLSLVAGALDQVTLSKHDEALLDDYVCRQIAQCAQLDPPALPPPGRTEEGSEGNLS